MPSIDDLATIATVMLAVFTAAAAVTLAVIATADPRRPVRDRAARLLVLLLGRHGPKQ